MAPPPARDLIFFNGLGGFTPDGREYVITTAHGHVTPAPWVNVLANPHFGTVISESGAAYTWSENAHEFRLTPWHNDPVSDASGEAFYIRDEESGHFWSPTPLPSRGATPYVTRHGFGYSVFEHTEERHPLGDVGLRGPGRTDQVHGAQGAKCVGPIPPALGHRICRMGAGRSAAEIDDARDHRNRPRQRRAVGAQPLQHGVCRPGRLLRRQRLHQDRERRPDRIPRPQRNAFANPAAMARSRLSGRVGAALDPCAAIQVPFELADGQEREIVFTLGAGRDADDASNLARRFRGSGAARGALEAVWQYWKHTLGAVHVETPDPSLNVLTNGWLLYQTLACRLVGAQRILPVGRRLRFPRPVAGRDGAHPRRARSVREHLLLCASRQFLEGDVQHWWHPPSGRGVRTHCSDDYLWLPLAACRYVLSTGDTGVLDEPVHFLEGRPVNPDEDSYYGLPTVSEETGHPVSTLRAGHPEWPQFGVHGLPLIGSGDWNDGMNLVGKGGKGESVWLGFFLYDVLMRFTEIARSRGDASSPSIAGKKPINYSKNIEQNGWDGEWYRRAYFDDGSPLGSASNPECQIDSIAQSWSVLSGAGDDRRRAWQWRRWISAWFAGQDSLIQLLDPPFDKSSLDPGYIKGYVPGVRENGGQYTHAAIWAVMAFAELGDSRRAWELFAMINPVNHARSPRRRLRPTRWSRTSSPPTSTRLAAHRPRRVDLVHRLSRLDVPADPGIASRPAPGSGQATLRAVPPRRLERVQGPLPVPRVFFCLLRVLRVGHAVEDLARRLRM